MRELGRLLRFSRPYTPYLVLSVLLMACVGAAQAFTALLIGPIFDRVLNPASADAPVLLVTIPIFHHKVYLSDLMPASIHNVWTMVAVGILAVFFIKGSVRLLRQLSDQLRGLFRGDGSAPDRVRPRGASGRAFLRSQFDGARDVVDHERPGKDPGRAVANSGGLAAAKLHRAGTAGGGVADRLETGRW